jgi:hypothetical protein
MEVCQDDLAPMLPESLRNSYGKLLPSELPEGCLDTINDPTRTLLGITQKSLFKQSLLDSTASFKFVITSVPIQQTFVFPYDSWEGYAFERNEILNFIRQNGIENVIFLSNNQFQSMIGGVYVDRFTDSDPVAYEFSTGPMASLIDPRWTLGPTISNTTNHILDLIETNCRHSGQYSYGSVEMNPSSGITKIVLRGQDGQVLSDQVNHSKSCQQSFHTSLSNSNNLSKNSNPVIQQPHMEDLQLGSTPLQLTLPMPLS